MNIVATVKTAAQNDSSQPKVPLATVLVPIPQKKSAGADSRRVIFVRLRRNVKFNRWGRQNEDGRIKRGIQAQLKVKLQTMKIPVEHSATSND